MCNDDVITLVTLDQDLRNLKHENGVTRPKRHHGDMEEKTWEFHHVRGTTNKHTHMFHVTLSRV